MNRLVLAALIVIPPALALAQDAATDEGPYSAIIERPLFDPSRTKYVPPPPPPPPDATDVDTAPPPDQAAPMPDLIGVVKSDDDAIAIVRNADGQVFRLAAGEQVDGWRIMSIDTASVDVERDGDRETLDMPVVANSGPPPPSPDDAGVPAFDDAVDPNSGDQ